MSVLCTHDFCHYSTFFLATADGGAVMQNCRLRKKMPTAREVNNKFTTIYNPWEKIGDEFLFSLSFVTLHPRRHWNTLLKFQVQN